MYTEALLPGTGHVKWHQKVVHEHCGQRVTLHRHFGARRGRVLHQLARASKYTSHNTKNTDSTATKMQVLPSLDPKAE